MSTLTHLTATLPAFGVAPPVGRRLTDTLCLVFLPALPTPGNSPINGPDQDYPTAAAATTTTSSNCRPFHIFCHFMFSVVSKLHPPTHPPRKWMFSEWRHGEWQNSDIAAPFPELRLNALFLPSPKPRCGAGLHAHIAMKLQHNNIRHYVQMGLKLSTAITIFLSFFMQSY